MSLDLSPFTRRLLALTLLVVVILVVVNLVVVPLASALGTALEALHDARFRTGELAALAARPALPRGDAVDPACCLAGPPTAAALALRALIVTAAATSHVTLGQTAPVSSDPRSPDVAAVDIAASGDEAAIMTFIAGLEQGKPVLRLLRWRITVAGPPGEAASPAASTKTGADVVHLDARIAAAVRPAR